LPDAATSTPRSEGIGVEPAAVHQWAATSKSAGHGRSSVDLSPRETALFTGQVNVGRALPGAGPRTSVLSPLAAVTAQNRGRNHAGGRPARAFFFFPQTRREIPRIGHHQAANPTRCAERAECQQPVARDRPPRPMRDAGPEGMIGPDKPGLLSRPTKNNRWRRTHDVSSRSPHRFMLGARTVHPALNSAWPKNSGCHPGGKFTFW